MADGANLASFHRPRSEPPAPVEPFVASDLPTHRNAIDARLGGFMEAELAASTAVNEGSAPDLMSAAEWADAAQVSTSSAVDKKSTAAFRKCMLFCRKYASIYGAPDQAAKTQTLAAAGSLFAEDARVRLPAIFKDVETGQEMEKLSERDFFYVVGTYMCNSDQVRLNMKGESKKNHLNNILRVYREFCSATPGREQMANFEWKKKMPRTWGTMQKDTMARADRGEEKPAESADPFSRAQVASLVDAADDEMDVRIKQSAHQVQVGVGTAHRAPQGQSDKWLHFRPYLLTSAKPTRFCLRFQATYKQKNKRVGPNCGMRVAPIQYVQEFKKHDPVCNSTLPAAPGPFQRAHQLLSNPTHRPSGQYQKNAQITEINADGTPDMGKFMGACYLAPTGKKQHFNEEGVLFKNVALSAQSCHGALKILWDNLEKKDPEKFKKLWRFPGWEFKKWSTHSFRATFRLWLRQAGVPEPYIDLYGGWALSAGQNYGHQTGVCPVEVGEKCSDIIYGWCDHYDPAVANSSRLLVQNKRLAESQSSLLEGLARHLKAPRVEGPVLALESGAEPDADLDFSSLFASQESTTAVARPAPPTNPDPAPVMALLVQIQTQLTNAQTQLASAPAHSDTNALAVLSALRQLRTDVARFNPPPPFNSDPSSVLPVLHQIKAQLTTTQVQLAGAAPKTDPAVLSALSQIQAQTAQNARALAVMQTQLGRCTCNIGDIRTNTTLASELLQCNLQDTQNQLHDAQKRLSSALAVTQGNPGPSAITPVASSLFCTPQRTPNQDPDFGFWSAVSLATDEAMNNFKSSKVPASSLYRHQAPLPTPSRNLAAQNYQKYIENHRQNSRFSEDER